MELSPKRDHVASLSHSAHPPSDPLRTIEGPTAAQWQAVKEDIRILYEQYPLKEVKRILEKGGFMATERMFKSRLSSWGFIKNSSDKEYQVCALLLKARKDRGKLESVFVINGNRRSLKDLRKYIKGRKMTDEQFLAIAQENEAAGNLRDFEHVRCESLDPELDAEAKYSPGSTRTPSDSHDSPPPRPALPLWAASPPQHVQAQLKCESSGDFASSQANVLSNPSPPRRDGRRGLSMASRRKRLSSSSHAHTASITPHPTFENSPPTSSVHPSAFGFPSDRPLTSAMDIPSDNPNYCAYGMSTERPHRSMIDSPGTIETRRFYTPGHSPACEHFNQNDMEILAHSTVYSHSLSSSYGTDNVDALRKLSPHAADPMLQDYEVVCQQCRQPSSSHFSSLQSTVSTPHPTSHQHQTQHRRPARAILNPSAEVPTDSFQVAPSAKDRDHCCRWVSRCFTACIWSMKRKYDCENTRAADIAQFMLSEADIEFEAMLRSDDEKLTLTLNQTIMVLHMHSQGEICEKIMKSAADVAERVVGLNHPAGIITRFMWWAGNPKKLREQREITSSVLRRVWEHYTKICPTGETDLRSIGALYCLGYMLNVEAGRDGDKVKLIESERVVRECYRLSCTRLGRDHLQSIMAITNLRLNLERQGRIDEAIECAQTAIDDSLETLGPQHPRRLETMRLLAKSYEQKHRYVEAENLYWQVLEGRVHLLGVEHKFTRSMKEDLIKFLKKMDKWVDEADGGCPEQERINDMFSYEMVDSTGSGGEEADIAKEAERHLKAY